MGFVQRVVDQPTKRGEIERIADDQIGVFLEKRYAKGKGRPGGLGEKSRGNPAKGEFASEGLGYKGTEKKFLGKHPDPIFR